MQEKAEQGIWPTGAPLGYLNVLGPDGKKTIAPDPKIAPIITHLFGWYATGTLSLREAAEQARSAGLVYRRTGKPVPTSTVHAILRNRIYTGDFEWKGRYCRAFLDTYRTLCLAPTPEIHQIFEQLRGGSAIASAC